MTVEMKVRLTIKEEETIHWTTTLTRSSVDNQLSVASLDESGQENRSPESKTLLPEQPSNAATIDLYDARKKDRYDDDDDDLSPEASGLISVEGDDEDQTKAHVGMVSPWRAPTPGPRAYRPKQASLESIQTSSGDEVQTNTLGSYSYRETTENGGVKEEYCIVKQCSSRPVPKPRRVGSMEINNYRQTQSTFKSGTAEILQIRNGEEEVRESVMHICKEQTCQENSPGNSQFTVQGVSMYGLMYGRPATSDTARLSSSNDQVLELEVAKNKIIESPSMTQEQYFSLEEHNLKDDSIWHRCQQMDKENWEESEAKCTDKHSSQTEHAYRLALHDGYLNKPSCPLEAKDHDKIQSSFLEEEHLKEKQECYIERQHLEQEIKCMGEQVGRDGSTEQDQTSSGEDLTLQNDTQTIHYVNAAAKCAVLKISSEDEVQSMELQLSSKENSKDQVCTEDEEKCHVEDQLRNVESEKHMDKECFEDVQQCNLGKRPSCVGLLVSYEIRESINDKQACSGGKLECNTKEQPNHRELVSHCLDLQVNNEEEKCAPKEDQASSDEELEGHVMSYVNHKEVKCMDTNAWSPDIMSSSEEELASTDKEHECHTDNYPSHERGDKYTEMQVCKEKTEFTREENEASFKEEEEIHANYLSYADAHINIANEQTHLWINQTSQVKSTVIEMLPDLTEQHFSAEQVDKDCGKDCEQNASFDQLPITEGYRCSSREQQVNYAEKLSSSEEELFGLDYEAVPEEARFGEFQEIAIEEDPPEEDKSAKKPRAKTIKLFEEALPSVAERVKQLDMKIADVEERQSKATETTGSKRFSQIEVHAVLDGSDDRLELNKFMEEASVMRTTYHGMKDVKEQDNIPSKVISDISYFNSTSSFVTYTEPTRCIAFNAKVGPGESVQIDKKRGLPGESVIRKSVSEPMNINKNTSASTEDLCKDTKEDIPYSLSVRADLENTAECVRPSMPKCTYFNLPHGCDSDPHQDDLSSVSKGSDTDDAPKGTEMEEPKVGSENGSTLNAQAPTHFIRPDNKVHPLIECSGEGKVVLEQPGKCQSPKGQNDAQTIPKEPDALEMLYLSCGQHCPIL
ncbi:hypothetical protein DPEC_G00074060 [Dallia pectoralis]|uniref:Uncharacterized protein n=1 Tax=Dallia pectoralis TaxID=75939 RepID=A0ACC2H3P2_DALPE|nr:hypothetical protein DPEC_G00074060 [Dallia pectoralis]